MAANGVRREARSRQACDSCRLERHLRLVRQLLIMLGERNHDALGRDLLAQVAPDSDRHVRIVQISESRDLVKRWQVILEHKFCESDKGRRTDWLSSRPD